MSTGIPITGDRFTGSTDHQAARLRELGARAVAAREELRAAVVEAAATMTEVDIARASGVSRPTVRAWKAAAGVGSPSPAPSSRVTP